jgi:hypothetical protein
MIQLTLINGFPSVYCFLSHPRLSLAGVMMGDETVRNMRSMFCTLKNIQWLISLVGAKFMLMTWLSFQIVVIQQTILKISWLFISPWIKIFMFLFTTDRSLNKFLLFFFVLLLVEVAVSVAFLYAIEINDKHSK